MQEGFQAEVQQGYLLELNLSRMSILRAWRNGLINGTPVT